jgi:hypothetical protein
MYVLLIETNGLVHEQPLFPNTRASNKISNYVITRTIRKTIALELLRLAQEHAVCQQPQAHNTGHRAIGLTATLKILASTVSPRNYIKYTSL